jgi:hypothetical protein
LSATHARHVLTLQASERRTFDPAERGYHPIYSARLLWCGRPQGRYHSSGAGWLEYRVAARPLSTRAIGSISPRTTSWQTRPSPVFLWHRTHLMEGPASPRRRLWSTSRDIRAGRQLSARRSDRCCAHCCRSRRNRRVPTSRVHGAMAGAVIYVHSRPSQRVRFTPRANIRPMPAV